MFEGAFAMRALLRRRPTIPFAQMKVIETRQEEAFPAAATTQCASAMHDPIMNYFALRRGKECVTFDATKGRLGMLNKDMLRQIRLGREAFAAVPAVIRFVVVLFAMCKENLFRRKLLATKTAVEAMERKHVLTQSDLCFETGNAADIAIVENADLVNGFHMLK